MKRDIDPFLIEWKKSKRRKPLVLHGARQVGKTYSLQYFGKNSYTNVAYFNFEKDERLAQYFDGSLEPKQLIKFLSIHHEIAIHPNTTLLIFDEIQECPRALNSLKYFCEEANEFHIAAAGSLLGVKIKREKGFPVGKVNFLHLYPLSFFEFLSAIDRAALRDLLEEQNDFNPLPEPLHNQLLEILKIYLYVGGMPESVAEYIKTENLKIVREIHLEILNFYEKDFSKYASPHDVMKITTIWNQIPSQLAKENKKFVFSMIRKSARGREFEEAIQWLVDAGLVHKNYLVASPKYPLNSYINNSAFKIFSIDVGLLCTQSKLSAQILINGHQLFTEFKGSLTENFIAQELIAYKHSLYYWTSMGIAEIDFLIEHDHEIYPLEVKAGTSQKKKSLHVYHEKYAPSKLLRASTMNLKQDGIVYNYPLYLVKKIVEEGSHRINDRL